MKLSKLDIGAFFLTLLAFAPGCSLETGKHRQTLKIFLEEKQQASLFQMLTNSGIMATPTTAADFNCFGVNVTGAGIIADINALHDCTTTDNMHGRGVGILSPRLVPRGTPIEMDVPSGTARNIDVYGIDPPGSECVTGSSGSSTQSVYFLGGVTKDLAENAEVTVPISFVSGTAASMTCTKSGSTYTATIDGSVNTAFKSSTCFNGSTVNSSAPSPGTAAGVAFTGGENTNIATSNGSFAINECAFSGSLDVQVQEFSFGISASTASSLYPQVSIKWVGAAGFYAGACSSAAISGSTQAGSFPKLEIFNNNTSTWETIGSPTTTQSSITATFSPTVNYVSSGAVHVRVFGGQVTTGNCSKIESDTIEAFFH